MDEKQTIATRMRVFRALAENPTWADVLEEALRVEDEKTRWYAQQGYGEFPGWEWWMVREQQTTLYRMVSAKLLDINLKTRSATHFKISNPEVVRQALEAAAPQEVPQERVIPDDLFASVVGHDDIKRMLGSALKAKKRVGVLLHGPPASAKTQFLMELARLPGSLYCLAQTMSAAGLAHALRAAEPDVLIIDELDRLDPGDVGVLNSILATGWVVETKMGKGMPFQLNTKVFAAGINIQKLPQDLLSRFVRLRFPPYTRAQFVDICNTILPQEGLDPEASRSIGEEVWGLRGEKADIRECVAVARLALGESGQVEDILRVLRQQGA